MKYTYAYHLGLHPLIFILAVLESVCIFKVSIHIFLKDVNSHSPKDLV